MSDADVLLALDTRLQAKPSVEGLDALYLEREYPGGEKMLSSKLDWIGPRG